MTFLPLPNATIGTIDAGACSFRLVHVPVLDSTHQFLVQHPMGVQHGTVLCADYQVHGRGRCDRSWIAPPGKGLLFSLALKGAIPHHTHHLLSPVMALAIAQTLQSLDLDIEIRWPNDIFVGNEKIAGVLAEAVLTGQHLELVVLSAGINLLQTRDELRDLDCPATSVAALGGALITPSDFLHRLLTRFSKMYARFQECGFAPFYPEWRDCMSPSIGIAVIQTQSGGFEGTICGYGEDGSMILQLCDGTTRAVHAGEVTRVRTKPTTTE